MPDGEQLGRVEPEAKGAQDLGTQSWVAFGITDLWLRDHSVDFLGDNFCCFRGSLLLLGVEF